MITFDKNFFHITNGKISYVIEISRERYLFHRYFGKAIREFRDSAPLQGLDRGFSPQPAAWENERTYSLDVLPQEYPMRGHSDFRIPAYEIELPDGTNIVELFRSCEIIATIAMTCKTQKKLSRLNANVRDGILYCAITAV